MVMINNARTGTQDELEKVYDLIEGIDFAMLTTAQPDGSLRSRPMATQRVERDGEVWFFTGLDSGKVHEIDREHHVNLAYADPDHNRYVSISGLARITQDRDKAASLWSPAMKAWFPEGLDDPNLAMIEVRITGAEYWDAPSSTMVQLYGMAKSMLTGEPPTDIGDHGSIRMR